MRVLDLEFPALRIPREKFSKFTHLCYTARNWRISPYFDPEPG